ncbi:uncharacterized protein METZ01_LOCUS426080, partial [marine metagenome]
VVLHDFFQLWRLGDGSIFFNSPAVATDHYAIHSLDNAHRRENCDLDPSKVLLIDQARHCLCFI